MQWLIFNAQSGHVFGVYAGESEVDAIGELLRDASEPSDRDAVNAALKAGVATVRWYEVTDEQIHQLRTEAGEAGDRAMARICDRAMDDGDLYARAQVGIAINAASAMR